MTFDDLLYSVDAYRISFNSFFIVLILLIICPDNIILSSSFPAFRMQQFDLHGISYEAKSLYSTNWIRKCLLVNLSEISNIHNIINKAGSLVIILPENFQNFANKESFLELEHFLVHTEIGIPVYFILDKKLYHDELTKILKTVGDKKNNLENTALNEMITAASTNTYFVNTKLKHPNTVSRPLENYDLLNIQSKLSGYNGEEMPNILIVTHMDTFGLIPGLSFGCDSNGSGMSVFLELARILKLIYSSKQLLPKFNIIFLMTSGGKFTYLGSKKWIEDHYENSESGALSDIAMILCLDSLGNLENPENLYFHVAKNPKNTSTPYKFYQILQSTISRYANLNDNPGTRNGLLNHVEIQVNNPKHMVWEHESFVPKFKNLAFTLSSHTTPGLGLPSTEGSSTTRSSIPSSHDPDEESDGKQVKSSLDTTTSYNGKKDTVLDTNCIAMVPRLKHITQILADSLVSFLFFQEDMFVVGTAGNTKTADFLKESRNVPSDILTFSSNITPLIISPYYSVSESHLKSLMELFGQYPRAQQLLTKDSVALSNIVNRFAAVSKDIKILPFRAADKREPEFVFYDNFDGNLVFFKSKPAIFDLYIAIIIGVYIGMIYLILMYFTTVSNAWIECLVYLTGNLESSFGGNNKNGNIPDGTFGSSNNQGGNRGRRISPASYSSESSSSLKHGDRVQKSTSSKSTNTKYETAVNNNSGDNNFLSHFYHNNLFKRNGYF